MYDEQYHMRWVNSRKYILNFEGLLQYILCFSDNTNCILSVTSQNYKNLNCGSPAQGQCQDTLVKLQYHDDRLNVLKLHFYYPAPVFSLAVLLCV